MVETALLLPILMLLMMVSDDFGRIFYYSIATTNAAREGARQGVYYDPANMANHYASDNADSIYSAVVAELPTGSGAINPVKIGPGDPRNCPVRPYAPSLYPDDSQLGNTAYVSICFNEDPNAVTAQPGQTVRVSILYRFAPVTPIPQMVGISSLNVDATTVMVVQAAS